MHTMYFLSRFLRNPVKVASVVPSSKHLANAMLKDVNLQPGDSVLEYGPGTGSFTQQIVNSVRHSAFRGGRLRYLGIERDPGFREVVMGRFPDLDFHLGDVLDQRRLIEEYRLPRPRLIISGLPFVSIPPDIALDILHTARDLLVPGGFFRAFSYLHAWPTPGAFRLRKWMDEIFDSFELNGPIALNVPPAFVLSGRA